MAKNKKISNLPILSGDVTLSNYLNEIKKFLIDYKINVSKLLKYESVLRSNQKKPFALVKNAIQIQSQFETYLDSFLYSNRTAVLPSSTTVKV